MALLCKASKGFGAATTGKKTGGKQLKSRLLDEAVKDAKSLGKAVPPNWQPARPIDQREAKRGRVDFVQVRDWGSGKPEDLGQLQVAEDDPATTITVDADSTSIEQQNRSSTGEAQEAQQQSLFRQLALAAGSRLIRQRMRKLPEIPSYEEWELTTTRYLKYLANLHTVHQALEETLAAAATCPPEAPGPSGKLLSEALQPVGVAFPIARSARLLSDLDAIRRAHTTTESEASTSSRDSEGEQLAARAQGSRKRGAKKTGQRGGADGGGGAVAADSLNQNSSSGVGGKEVGSDSSDASQGGSSDGAGRESGPGVQAQEYAVGYARYLRQLARSWRAADTQEEQVQLVGRMLAHAFIVHLTFASLVTRVGAAATEKLGLFQVGAVSAYKEYPLGTVDHVTGLEAAVDEVEGRLQAAGLQGAAAEAAIGELPRALEECAMLVLVLAAA